MSAEKQITILSPSDESVVFQRTMHTESELDAALSQAQRAQKTWRKSTLESRKMLCSRFAESLRHHAEAWGQELTSALGRPARYAASEVRTAADRVDAMVAHSDDALARVDLPPKENFERHIERVPLGVVLVVPAWNYPYLIAVNSIVPALLAGNTVVIKHSEQSAFVGDRLLDAFKYCVDDSENVEMKKLGAFIEAGIVQSIHTDHEGVARLIEDERVNALAFTGSTEGGRAVNRAASGRFISVGLELGGKDPAYVRHDADAKNAAVNLADGAFFNSGQSCCGVERIYVHAKVYDEFVSAFVKEAESLVLGDPKENTTTLGPMTKPNGAMLVAEHVTEAIAQGAKSLVKPFSNHQKPNVRFMSPVVLTEVTHEMRVMKEETFGPVACIMKVNDDDEALRLMNDSVYGLTASIWTHDEEKAYELASELNTGTVFTNRCDFLDPDLAWVGVKESGRGCTLSPLGFEAFTRPKSFHFKKA